MAGRHARAILPASSIDAPELVQICINREWLPVLHTAIARLEWAASWQADTDIDRAEQQILTLYQILRAAMRGDSGMCGDCCDQLNASLQILVRNSNLTTNITINQQASTYQTEYRTYWNAPTTNVRNDYTLAPDVTFSSSATDTPAQAAKRPDVLCYAAGQLTQLIYDSIKKVLADGQNQTNIFSNVVGIVGALGSLIPGVGWAIAVGAAVLAGVMRIINSMDTSGWNALVADQAIQDEIQCKVKAALKERPATQAEFVAALAAMPEGTGDEQAMTIIFKAAIEQSDQTALYNGFLAALSEGMQPDVFLPPCACDDQQPTIPAILNGWRYPGETVWRDPSAVYEWRNIALPVGTEIEVRSVLTDRWIATLGRWEGNDNIITIINGVASTVGVFDTNGSGTNNGYLAAGQAYTAAQINLWDVEIRTVTILSYV